MTGRLFLLTGTSGSGKTTVATELLKRKPNLRRVVTYTTRSPREGEVNGVSYNFVDQPTFQNMIDEGAFFEWAEVYGNHYGQSKADVEGLLNKGFDVLLVLDPQGAKTIKMSGFPATAIFLDTSDEELLRRLESRDLDDKEVIQNRIDEIAFDRSHIPFCDNVVINERGHLEETLKTMEMLMNGFSATHTP